MDAINLPPLPKTSSAYLAMLLVMVVGFDVPLIVSLVAVGVAAHVEGSFFSHGGLRQGVNLAAEELFGENLPNVQAELSEMVSGKYIYLIEMMRRAQEQQGHPAPISRARRPCHDDFAQILNMSVLNMSDAC